MPVPNAVPAIESSGLGRAAVTLADVLTTAIAFHHTGGNGIEAQRLCQAILNAKAEQFEALHYFGVCEAQRGQFEPARCLLTRALEINAESFEAHTNLGNVLLELKRYDEALASYDRALALKPDYAQALGNRGNVLLELKRHEEALASYDRALALNPDYAEAHYNRGNALLDLKRLEEALASYDRALGLRPEYAGALSNRGDVLCELKRHEEALASYDRALALDGDNADTLNSRGIALQELRRYEAAAASYERALALRANFAEALSNRGNTLRELCRYPESLASFGKALAISPEFADALYSRSVALRQLNRHEEAIVDLERLLAIKPEQDYARGELLDSRMHCGDWRLFEQSVLQMREDMQAGHRSCTPFFLLHISGAPADQLQCALSYVRDKHPRASRPIWRGGKYRHDRIRIAYLSADFREHAVSYLLAGLFERHDRSRFEPVAMSFGPDTASGMRTRLKGAFERFVDVRDKSDREVAVLMRELEVDIAVDLTGLTQNNRTGIFALRAAPVQVNYLGYPGTMGADYIDYIIADRFVIPEEQQANYAEKVVYLPNTFQANDANRYYPERAPTRAGAGLPERGFVFCAFNNTNKLTPRVFDVWMRLLRKVEGSVLWLLGSNDAVRRNLRREAAERGILPERLIFAPQAAYAEYLARYRVADLFLDCMPFGGGTTASDALWCGLPLVTCAGEAFAGRMAGSLLHAVGLPELITRSLEDYEALALKLAADGALLAGIRAKLAHNRTTQPLFDTDRFRRHLEAAYVVMWERSQRGEPPVSFAVKPIPESA